VFRHQSIPADGDGEYARAEINKLLPSIKRYMKEANTYPIIEYTPSAMAGGRVIPNIDLLENMFRMSRIQMNWYDIMDSIQKTLGYYIEEIPRAIIRTLNPFQWLSRLIACIIRFLIRILLWVGFDELEDFESSHRDSIRKTARIITVFLTIISFLANISEITNFLLTIFELISKAP